MPSFRDILGQSRPKAIVQGMLRTRQVPNALLFSGDDGAGKRSMAMVFAQTLLCLNPVKGGEEEGVDPCNNCLSCQKIESGNHPELILVQPEDKELPKTGQKESAVIKIDQIRDMQSRLLFEPVEAAWKIVLIVPAEKMNIQAQNSLLATLEEPPPYAVLILISKPDLLVPTILSRCRQVSFAPLSFSQIEAIVMARRGWPPHEARRAAVLTGGHLEEALSLSIEEVRERDEQYNGLVRADTLSRYDILFQVAAAFSKEATTFERALYYLSAYFRDILALLAAARSLRGNSTSLVFSWRQEELLEWSKRIDAQQAAEFIAEIVAIRGAMTRNINRQLTLETLLMWMRDRQI